MLIGCHGLLWTQHYEDPDVVDDAIAKTAAAGFDLIEIPVMDRTTFDPERVKNTLARHGLKASLSMGLGADTDISSEDPAKVAAGVQMLQEGIDLAQRSGATHVVGNLFSPLGKRMEHLSAQGYKNSQSGLSEAGALAETYGITLGLEITNRYENNVFNTIRGALAFVDGVTSPAVKLHIDAYHMNIEETDLFTPVLEAAAAGKIGYVHVGDGHRGYLGSGTVNLNEYFRALVAVGWDGPVVYETFSSEILEPWFSALLGLWRPTWSDPADVAAHANRYIRNGLHAAAATYGRY